MQTLKAKILLFVIALLLVVQGVSLYTFYDSTHSHTQEQIQSELEVGERVFFDKLETDRARLLESARVIARDDGLRQAIFADRGDPASLTVALDNHRRRADAGMAALMDTDGSYMAHTGDPASMGRPFTHAELFEDNAARTGFMLMEEKLYHGVLVPVYIPVAAPVPSFWLLMANRIDDAYARDLSYLTHLEIFFKRGAGQRIYATSVADGRSRAWRAMAVDIKVDAEQAYRSQVAGEAYLSISSSLSAMAPGGESPELTVTLLRPMTPALLDFNQLLGRVTLIILLASGLALLGAWLISGTITRPVRRLVTAAQRIGRGEFDTRLPAREGGEIGQLAHEFGQMQQAVREREQAIEYLAFHDRLTGLANRNQLHDHLKQQIGAHPERRLLVLVMNLDRFGEINDALGHTVGDQVLSEFARRLQAYARDLCFVARLLGDEFCLVAPLVRADEGARMADELQSRLIEPVEVEGLALHSDTRFGIAMYPEHGQSAEALIHKAHFAAGAARHDRRGIAEYDTRADQESMRRLTLMSQLRETIEADGLDVHFHPKLDLARNEISHAEALVRWQHPNHGFINPEEFIGWAEQTGNISHLTAWMLDRSMLAARRWREQGYRLSVAVNVSAIDLSDETFTERVRTLMDRHGIDGDQLMLEITESAIMRDPACARETLHGLEAMGVGLSIDDFGTGYSSMAQLRDMPVHELKIDKGFVLDVVENRANASIVQSTIELGHNLGLWVVAEGVESAEALACLRTWDCDMAQGFYLTRPLSQDDFTDWLRADYYPVRRVA